MEWVEFEIEKPTKSGDYFVKGKSGNMAIMYYCVEDDDWEINGYPTHKFSREYIWWLRDVSDGDPT
jgi:hypothetical protein